LIKVFDQELGEQLLELVEVNQVDLNGFLL